MNDKDYNLLRPFDLDAVKPGEPVLWGGQWETVTFVGRSRNGKTNIIECESGLLNSIHYARDDQLRMAPLCWVEEKPVYKGDVLWHTTLVKITAAHGRKDNVEGFVCTDGDYVSACNLTWTQPKVKREGWVNIYTAPPGSRMLANTSHIYPTAKAAAECGSNLRIDCVRIEWEEAAK